MSGTLTRKRISNKAVATKYCACYQSTNLLVQNIIDPLLLLQQFMTDQIVEVIVKRTNFEIVRRTMSKIKSTQNDTSKEKIRVRMSILV